MGIDFRPRTKAGSFYRRSAKRSGMEGPDIIRIDGVNAYRRGDEPLSPGDYEVVIVGTLTDVGKDGPSEYTQMCSHFMKLHEFNSHGEWRKIKESDLPERWKSFFSRNPM